MIKKKFITQVNYFNYTLKYFKNFKNKNLLTDHNKLSKTNKKLLLKNIKVKNNDKK